ncbi:MAG: class I SAM-dependent methyltransferase [Phycisphaeraceae bacterium]
MSTDTDADDSTDAEPTDDDLERHWTIILAEYWRQADWDQFSGQQKSRAATFEERLLSAQNAGDVHGVLKKLARGLGMAAPELPTANLDPLVEHDDRAMRVLRRLTDTPDASDDARLLEAARRTAARRVIVKRPRLGPTLTDDSPSHRVDGKAIRFDIYEQQPKADKTSTTL